MWPFLANSATAFASDSAPSRSVFGSPDHPLRAGLALRLVGQLFDPTPQMINELEGLTGSSFNGKPTMRTGQKSPERSGYELLAWAILEQAVDDLATFARYGLITPEGQCLPWPFEIRRRFKMQGGRLECFNHRARAQIVCCTGPHEHRQLRAWFLSAEAQTFCDLIGCNLDPQEIFHSTIKNHGGGKS